MSKKRDEQLIALSRRLDALGISLVDQEALRHVEMTLQRWAEQECGGSNDYCSWAIIRDEKTGKPYRQVHRHENSKRVEYAIADKERGALKRLRELMARYPELWYYHQGDPRGCALYVGRWADLPSRKCAEESAAEAAANELDSHYAARGVAVCL